MLDKTNKKHNLLFQSLLQMRIKNYRKITSIFFSDKPSPAFPRSVAINGHTFITIFSGSQNNNILNERNEISQYRQAVTDLFYLAPNTPVQQLWTSPCKKLGFIITFDRLMISWNDHINPTTDEVTPDVWQMYPNPSPDLFYLSNALQARRTFSQPGEIQFSLQLSKMIYQRVYELMRSQEIGEHLYLGTATMIRRYVANNFCNEINCKTIAAQFDFSSDYVSRIFKRDGGFSKYLNRLRSRRALELLNQTNFSVSKIAELCGFSTTSYFIKVFRSHYGNSPHNFRKEKKTAGKERVQPE